MIIHSISELTRFLWKRVEKRERVNGLFKDKGEMYAWVRRNIKTSIVRKQYVTSRIKTAGKKLCSLCSSERVNIFIVTNSEGSNIPMNKKTEFKGVCNCNAKFLRLYLEGVGALTRLPVVAENCLTKLARRDQKLVQKGNTADPKRCPNKVHEGPKGSQTSSLQSW